MAAKLLRDKIGYKPGHAVLLLDLPGGIADPFDGVEHTVALAKKAKLGKQKFETVFAFAQDQSALAATAKAVLGSLADDARVWLAYPKKSGKIATDLTRDAGWGPMFDAGWIVVAIVSIDETWSAVRFRPKLLLNSIRYPKQGIPRREGLA